MNEPGDLHVMPEGDRYEHSFDYCSCLPRTRSDRAGNKVVIHNAYDARETGEVCRKTLDLLALALTEHGHAWTDEERTEYEHAILVLNMHWPAKDAEPPMKSRGGKA